MEQKIKEALEQIRPILQRDGGDIEFVDLTDDTVHVRLQGHCAGCPGARMTSKGCLLYTSCDVLLGFACTCFCFYSKLEIFLC